MYLQALLNLTDVRRQSPTLYIDLFYIAQAAAHDFYIVRFVNQGRIYTVVVMLQPAAWAVINGDTVDGDLSSVLRDLPVPVRIHSNTYEFVIIAYNEWKERILRRQGKR